jgi:hypothetical protein
MLVPFFSGNESLLPGGPPRTRQRAIYRIINNSSLICAALHAFWSALNSQEGIALRLVSRRVTAVSPSFGNGLAVVGKLVKARNPSL